MSKMAMILITVSAVACASDPGTHPHDMSVAQHQSAANQEEAAAQGHEGQYDPEAAEDSKVCAQATTIRPSTQDGPPCWTSRSNPTAQHQADAARHRELAAKHRAGSAALVQAEQRDCVGIDAADRDMSPFYHVEDIVSVEPARLEAGGFVATGKLLGATVVFRAVPGLTAQWLEHTVKCHIARASALGHQVPEMSYCPLVLENVEASISPAGDGLAVQVRSQDERTAEEILRRAQALRSGTRGP